MRFRSTIPNLRIKKVEFVGGYADVEDQADVDRIIGSALFGQAVFHADPQPHVEPDRLPPVAGDLPIGKKPYTAAEQAIAGYAQVTRGPLGGKRPKPGPPGDHVRKDPRETTQPPKPELPHARR